MQQLQHFRQLRKAVLDRFRKHHPEWDGDIATFRSTEIARLQAHILEQTGGRISEKWFYTHLKPERTEKLPRTDMLDLLAQFAGEKSWNDFVQQREQKAKKIRRWPWLSAAAVGILVIAWMAFLQSGDFHFRVCFIDADTRQPLTDLEIVCFRLSENESPQEISVEGNCAKVISKTDTVELVVKAAYYHPDTIRRILTSRDKEETYALRADDYALMIHYFSANRLEDWQRRRRQLEEMIAPNARIIQVAGDKKTGMEIYNRSEFINKLTMPIRSLQQMEVISTEYDATGKIQGMRFHQSETK